MVVKTTATKQQACATKQQAGVDDVDYSDEYDRRMINIFTNARSVLYAKKREKILKKKYKYDNWYYDNISKLEIIYDNNEDLPFNFNEFVEYVYNSIDENPYVEK